MTLQEQIFQASDTYEKSRWSHGVIDPVVLDEIGDAYYQGEEYGYKLAVDKAREFLRNNLHNYWEYNVSEYLKFLNEFIKAMKGGEE